MRVFGFAGGKLSRERWPVESCTARVQARFNWPRTSPRWCLEGVSRPGGLISAGPNSLRRSSSCISNAVEPSEHCGAGMGDPHAVVHVKCSNQHAGTSHFSLPHPAISAQSVQIFAPNRTKLVYSKNFRINRTRLLFSRVENGEA